MPATLSPRRDVLETLGNLASGQEGFFAAIQALEVGIPRHRLARLARSGILERDKRGIYRFSSYPDTENAELWRAVLWPSVSRGNKINAFGKGVLSHATALDLWNASTINPSTIDLTLPKAYRVRRGVPSVYRLHFIDLTERDIKFIGGLPVTTLFRSLADLIVEGREHQFVDEALARATVLNKRERDALSLLRSLKSRSADDDTAALQAIATIRDRGATGINASAR